MVHTEATLNGLNNPNLIKLVLQLESEVNSNVKYSERQSSCKDSLQVLRSRKDLKSLNLTALDFPERTRIFRNGSVCAYYHDLQNKCKKLNSIGKLNVFFVSNGKIKVKILENDPVKPVTNAAHLKKMFPDVSIDNL